MKVEIKKVKDLRKKEEDLFNKWRKIRFEEIGLPPINYKKKFPLNSDAFILKKGNKTFAFGILRPITISYFGKDYDILGICGVISIIQWKGYGKILMDSILKEIKKSKKTALGFCGRKNNGFYKKCGFKVKNDFIKRFIYKNPKTKEEVIDNDGDGIYYEGKDKFISKVLKTKSPVYINIMHW